MEQVTKKAFKMLHWVMRNLKESGRTTKEEAYKTLIRPILEYVSLLWDPYEKGLTKSIEKVQRKEARYVMGRHIKTESDTEMLQVL